MPAQNPRAVTSLNDQENCLPTCVFVPPQKELFVGAGCQAFNGLAVYPLCGGWLTLRNVFDLPLPLGAAPFVF